ncbi:MAG: hypothetical protein HRU19_22675 [Pseudobacteriovorax sp.]|nr:hypothetical protein [Pseudobacteriovorax sp.]
MNKFKRIFASLCIAGSMVPSAFGIDLSTQWPERSPYALSGSEFLQSVAGMSYEAREAAIVREIRSGNFPSHLRILKPIKTHMDGPSGKAITLTTYVTADYLAIGSDSDFVRIPMNLLSAQTIAELFQAQLPTRKLVDAIYKQSSVKVKPRPMKPGKQMTSSRYYNQHNKTVQKQIDRIQELPNQLIAGHKKDIVLSRKLSKKPQAIVIYGWHRNAEKPIQPLSSVHGKHYADYSHGIRLVSDWAVLDIDGEKTQVRYDQILQSQDLWPLVSDEGRFTKDLFPQSLQGLKNRI